MQKFSFNIHAYNVDRNAALKWVRENKPETVLVLNDPSFASQCADAGVKYPILRMTNNDDNIHLKITSFREWWDSVKANYADKRLVVHFANEPHPKLEDLSKFVVEGIRLLTKEGLRGVFGNFSVGTPEVHQLKNELRPMMQELAKFPDTMFLGLHEYMMGELEWNVPFEIARYREVLKLYNLSIIFTEFGYDFVQDVYNRHPEIGMKRGRKFYPDTKVMADFTRIFALYYNVDRAIKGVCAFSLGDSGGWDSFNFEGFDLNKFKVLEMDSTFVPYETMVRAKGTVTNRRSEPVVQAGNASPTPLTVDVRVTKLAINNGWALYRYADGDWWSASEFVVESPVPDDISSIKINLYNAPPEIVEEAEALVQRLMDIFTKYKADVG